MRWFWSTTESLIAHFVNWNTQVLEAIENETKINEARELYRPAAERASLLFFIINDLSKINPIYQFSLKVNPWRAFRRIQELYLLKKSVVFLVFNP